MRIRLFAALTLLALVLACSSPTLFSWGENADRLVANKAVDTLPEEMQPFFQANRQFLVQHVTDLQEAPPKSVIPFEHPRTPDFVELDAYLLARGEDPEQVMLEFIDPDESFVTGPETV